MKNEMTRVNAMAICKAMVEQSDRADKEDIIAILDKQIESLSRRSVSKADKEKAEQNEVIANAIVKYLGTVTRARVSDITKAVNGICKADYSSNKVSAQVTKLKNSGAIQRTEEKKVAYFSL